MFERFTDCARRVVVWAQEEACGLNHHVIDTEHILLGILNENDAVAVQVLQTFGISSKSLRDELMRVTEKGEEPYPSTHIPFAPRAKKVLELALREAIQLGHNHIGTEHFLLGIIRKGEGQAVRVLAEKECYITNVRAAVVATVDARRLEENALREFAEVLGAESSPLLMTREALEELSVAITEKYQPEAEAKLASIKALHNKILMRLADPTFQ